MCEEHYEVINPCPRCGKNQYGRPDAVEALLALQQKVEGAGGLRATLGQYQTLARDNEMAYRLAREVANQNRAWAERVEAELKIERNNNKVHFDRWMAAERELKALREQK